MFVTNVLVAGSVVFTGASYLVQHARQKTALARVASGQEAPDPPVVVVGDDRPALQTRQYSLLSAASLGFATGGLFFPALAYVSIPLTVYTTVPILDAGMRALFDERRLKPSVVTSVLLLSMLLTDRYLPAAALSWLHHTLREFGQRVEALIQQFQFEEGSKLLDLLRQLGGGTPQAVWLVTETGEVNVPFASVKIGDVLVVGKGEVISVVGTVLSGQASLNLALLTQSNQLAEVGVGDSVPPMAVVQSGRITVRVDSLRA